MKITKSYLKQLIKEELSNMEEATNDGNQVWKVVGQDGKTIAHVGSKEAADKLVSKNLDMMRALGLVDLHGHPWAWVAKSMPFRAEQLSPEEAATFMAPESSKDSQYYGTYGDRPKKDYFGIYSRKKGSL